MKLVKLIIAIVIAFLYTGLSAQKISGYVLDANNREPIPFANVWIKSTLQGTMADENGMFMLSLAKNDTICASSVGYYQNELRLEQDNNKSLTILLTEDIQMLEEVTIRPEENRAKILFKKILENKKINRDQVENVSDYKTLARTTVYVAIDSTSKVTRFIDNLDEVTMEIDDQELDFSPIYLAEEASRSANHKDSILYQKKDCIFPKLGQTIESLILINVVADLDFYKNQINILGRGITSPLSNSARIYYNIYLNDSTFVDSTKYYSFSFVPKNRFSALFTGRFTVEDGSFALTKIEAYLLEQSNINFVNGFRTSISYKKLSENSWFYEAQKIEVNMSLTLNKDTVKKYGSQRVDEISSGNWLVEKSTLFTTSNYLNMINAREWGNQPEFSSEKLQEGTYERVDKLKENSVVQITDAIGGMVLTSYINAGKIDIGPVFDIYSTNAIEGTRITVPFRTSEQMFEHLTMGGFLGYGTLNKEFKYGMNVAYQLLPTDKFIFRINYSNDYNLVSQDKYLRFIKKNPNTRGNGNFIAALTTSERNPYLKEDKSFDFRIEYNAEDNIGVEVSAYYLWSARTPDVSFIRNDTDYPSYENYGILVNFRLAFGQYYDKYYFARVYYIDQTPVINLSLDMGRTALPDTNPREFGIYSQMNASITGKINLGQTFMRYYVNGGYLFGDAPYDLLDQPVGSMSWGYAKYRFNLLHNAAMAHNVYANLHLDYNGGGIILNRIPLVRRLKLREMVSLKCHYGALNQSYKGVFDLPDYYSNEIRQPYAEIGIGLTNIFKVLRVEYIHLLGNSYVGSGFVDKSGIRIRAEMSF